MPQRVIHRAIGLPDQLLPRPADAVTMGLPGRVTLLTSATGYGKSTLLAAWARAYPHTIAWWSPLTAVQPEEVRPALDRVLLDAMGLGALDVVEEGPLDPVEWADFVRTSVLAYGLPLALVLDGPEYLHGDVAPLQRALRLLIEQQPPNLSVIIVSRNFPFAGAEVARLRGTLDVIDERMLRIPDDTVRSLLLERGVGASNADALVAFVDGWPAAIRIALTVVDAETSVGALRKQVNELGSARFFANALIDRIEPLLRSALITTSVLEIVNPEMAKVLGLSDEEAASLLTAYEQGIPMTKRQEDSPRSFSVHSLFRDELLERLRRENLDAEQRLRIAAARHFAGVGRFADAVEQYIAAKEYPEALALIKEQYTALLEAGYGLRMRVWFDIAGSQASPRIDRLRQQIYGAMLDGQLALSESLLASYENELQSRDVPVAYTVFLHINRAWVAQCRGDIEGSVTFAKAALRVLAAHEQTDDDPRRGEYIDAANDYIAQAAVLTDQPAESDPRVARIIAPQGREPRPSLWQDVNHPALLAHLALYRGEYNKALAFGERAIAATPERLVGSVLFPWPALTAVVGAYRETGNPQRAVDLVDRHMEAIERLPCLTYAVDLLAVRAHALADLGRTVEGTETFARLRKMVDTFGRGWWPFDRLDVHEARYVLRHGDTARASQIAERVAASAHAKDLSLRLEATRAPRRAQRILTSLTRHTPSQEIAFRLFSALLEPASSPQRDDQMKFALQIAQEHGTFRHIFDAGDAVADMVTAYVLRHPTRFGEALLARHTAAKSLATQSNGVVSLSSREHQILGLLSTDMPLQQVAKTLFVSQNTLKTHMRNLYRKMQVSDRQAAVERGRQLLLIN